MASFVPYDYGGEFPDGFWDMITDEGTFNGQEGWFTSCDDVNPANGIADFVDAYNGNPDIILKPSQGHDGT